MSVDESSSPTDGQEKKPSENVPLEKGEIEALKAYSMGMVSILYLLNVRNARSVCSVMQENRKGDQGDGG